MGSKICPAAFRLPSIWLENGLDDYLIIEMRKEESGGN